MNDSVKAPVSHKTSSKAAKIMFIQSSSIFRFQSAYIQRMYSKGKKQPPEVFFKKSCSQKFHSVHRKTYVLVFFQLCFMAEFVGTHCVKSRGSLSRFYEVHANSVLDHNVWSNMFKVFWKIYFFNIFTKFTGRNKRLRPFQQGCSLLDFHLAKNKPPM